MLNVGHLKYQDEYHIYDITKKGETANQSSTSLSQPVGNAIKNSFSNKSLPQQSENSQQKFSLRGDVEETKKLLKNFETKSINDYIGVQKAIINTLVEESFFSNGNNVIKNKDSGMIIEITKDGIKETFGKDYRFQTLPRQLKVLKLATVR